ncbi:MAG: HlyD family efflux transporter periplasmic adaptor subunit [Bacteroidetes bacterium]|nr:MAG: HlyD family efflux transporter periplasmic adaptor subunit [Bacteroidota bacterium]
MLNLSEQPISPKDWSEKQSQAGRLIFSLRYISNVGKVIMALFGIFVVLLFAPWTQNVYMEGYLTTLEPETRPQEIQSVIEGKIDKWYVKEGDIVHRGDTIARITEIKDIYWDPFLLNRTQEQIDAKEKAIVAYKSKIDVLEKQVGVLRGNMGYKIRQAENKMKQARLKMSADSAQILAAEIDFKNFKAQYERGKELYQQNLMSRTDLEIRQNKMQSAQAKLFKVENDYSIAQNEFLNAEIELNSVEADYLEKIFKIQSDVQSVVSELAKSNEELSKLNNTYSNYVIRAGNYYILAPQEGQIVSIHQTGLGENIKAGEALASITPQVSQPAVAFYVSAIDLPLFEKGRDVRILFDGWPSIVFSGWPGASFGTFGGKVQVIDNQISSNGKFRILVRPDTTDQTSEWPSLVYMGSGAKGYALLKDVPLWYEMWRRLNGFPPEFYKTGSPSTDKKERK